MSVSKKTQQDPDATGAKSRGLKLTEKLLPMFGPAQVGNANTPIRPPTEDEDAREIALENELVRKTGADGSTYLVEAPPE